LRGIVELAQQSSGGDTFLDQMNRYVTQFRCFTGKNGKIRQIYRKAILI